MFWPFVSRRERLRREASGWVARLNGPFDEADRAAFERWYNMSAEHAEAYDRLAALFNAAGRARRPESAGADSRLATAPGRSRPFRFALAAAVACAALLAVVLLAARTASPSTEARQQFATFSAGEGETRGLVLVDGSEVLLSPGSRLEVALGTGKRRLRLLQGEGRFTVAHEARPFVVAADSTEVMARGTRFVVRLAPDRTTVSLIEGRVDISYSSAAGGAGRRLARLQAGQQLVVEAASTRSPAARTAAAPVEPGTRAPQPAMLQFNDTPLGLAVEQVNRRGHPPVRFRDPGIAGLRVTGAFRAGDTAGFAESVGAAFDLEVERAADGSLWLRRPPDVRSAH
jgi:transmembrane sensor